MRRIRSEVQEGAPTGFQGFVLCPHHTHSGGSLESTLGPTCVFPLFYAGTTAAADMDITLWSSHEKMLTQPLKDSDAEVRLGPLPRLLHRLHGGVFLLLLCGDFVLCCEGWNQVLTC